MSERDVILGLLKDTAAAHGRHEEETGEADAEWPEWYSTYMTQAMHDAGYRLVAK